MDYQLVEIEVPPLQTDQFATAQAGKGIQFHAVRRGSTDLQLRPLRGKVEGKHTGKNVLVCSFAAVGEVAATLVGRGSLNQPLSEGDLLRERVANNIGQASDQTVANLALTERIVVSVPADTEIYVIFAESRKGERPTFASHSALTIRKSTQHR